jgi:hypothetical protein
VGRLPITFVLTITNPINTIKAALKMTMPQYKDWNIKELNL